MRVGNLRIEPVSYHAPQGQCRGANLIYTVDGEPACSRVPWVPNDTAAELARLECVIAKRNQSNRGLNDIRN